MAGGNNTDKTVFFVIYETFNFLFSLTFLFIFSYRHRTLKKLSKGVKYKEFFPRMRVVLALSYIVLSIVVIIYNVIVGLFPIDQAYNYVLQGGGASVINSVVLIIQLSVLKLELGREQRYTRYHELFFFTLTVFSTIRFVLSFQFGGYGQAQSIKITNIVLSGVLDVLSLFQFAYWAIKRHYLPFFRTMKQINIENQLVNQTIELPSPESKKCSFEDDFPYLMPWVSIEDGQIKVILQLNKTYPQESNIAQRPDSFTNKLPLISSRTTSMKRKSLSSAMFTYNELKSFIARCSRLPIDAELPIKGDLPQIAMSLRLFLTNLLRNKQAYQIDILKTLKLKGSHLNAYQRYQIKQISPKNDSFAVYCSIQVFNHIQVQDHHEYCIKAISGIQAYTARRFSDFQQFHQEMKAYLKQMDSKLQLPQLPRKLLSLFSGKDGLKNRQKAIEVYLRQLANDYWLMQEINLRQKILEFLGLPKNRILTPNFHESFYNHLIIVPKEVAQAMSNNRLVTLYEFQLKKRTADIRVLSKKYLEFESLHQSITRWGINAQVPIEIPKLPSLGFLTSELKLHQELSTYLQRVITLPDVGKIYAVNTFFKAGEDLFTTVSDNSDSEALKRSKVNIFKDVVIEKKRQSHFEEIMNDLGNSRFDSP